jgi:hypothetical protein
MSGLGNTHVLNVSYFREHESLPQIFHQLYLRGHARLPDRGRGAKNTLRVFLACKRCSCDLQVGRRPTALRSVRRRKHFPGRRS